jgi:hypothetical protein
VGHLRAISNAERALKLAGALVCVALLGGCGAVEFEGKIFDYMGVSGDQQEPDVRMSERPPLMVPPNLNQLPQPGTGSTVAAARPDWPDNPEAVRKRAAEEEEAKKAEVEAAANPTNPYAGKPTLLDRWLKPSKTDQPVVADVPEPDPSDRLPTETSTVASQPKALKPHVPQAPLPEQDTGPTQAPDSYQGMSNPSGNNANW